MAATALLLAAGCMRAERPTVEYELARNPVELGEASYLDHEPGGTLSILNTGAIDIIVTLLDFEGDGADLVEVDAPDDFDIVAPGDSTSIELALLPPETGWDSGTYAPALTLELGSLWDDPRTWEPAGAWLAEELTVAVTFTLACDLDADGSTAVECGGEDCDDGDAAVHPGATDDPTLGQDNDCDGVVEGSTAHADPGRSLGPRL